MTIQYPRKRTLVSAATVLCVAVLSWSVYELSASIGNAFAHELVAKLSGTAYFLAVAFGAFYVYVIASLDDAPLVTIAVSLSLVIGLYAWGRGENMYVLFLSGYRGLFGTGVSVR